MTEWQHIFEVGDCADILAAFFDDDGALREVAAMTLVTTERGKFWTYIEALDDRPDADVFPYEPWETHQPDYFIPLPQTPAAIIAKWEAN